MLLEKIEKPPGFKGPVNGPTPNSSITEEYYLNMGPQHPSTHGVLRLVVRLDGENIKEVVPHLGYIHRSIEKMGENESCLQYIHLTDRMDYLSSHMNNLGVCLAIEKALGIGVPERGEFIRVMVCELQRIQSHLLWWGVMGMDLGAITAFLYGFKEREIITELFEEICGARLTMNYFRPGGCYEDVPESFIPRVKHVIEEMKRAVSEMNQLLSNNLILQERTKGVGVLSAEKAIAYGCSGPVARASGVSLDIRKNDPYSYYGEFDFDIPLYQNGDCFDRYKIRIDEMVQSIRILEQAVTKFPDGPYRSKPKPTYKLPAGNHYSQVETARGLFGTYIVSQGKSDKPYRIKTRSPNFSNLCVIDEICNGFKIGDLVAILSTLDLVIPDIDR